MLTFRIKLIWKLISRNHRQTRALDQTRSRSRTRGSTSCGSRRGGRSPTRPRRRSGCTAASGGTSSGSPEPSPSTSSTCDKFATISCGNILVEIFWFSYCAGWSFRNPICLRNSHVFSHHFRVYIKHLGRSVLHVKSRHPRVGVDLPHGVVVGGLGVPLLLPYVLLLYM